MFIELDDIVLDERVVIIDAARLRCTSRHESCRHYDDTAACRYIYI